MSRAFRPVIFLFGVLATLVILVLGFFHTASGPTFTYRYRLTIEIDTPRGVKSGSSVIETTLQNNHDVRWLPPEARRFTAQTRGEAIFVDLGDGRHIIALLAKGPTGADDLEFRQIVPEALGVRWDTPQQAISAIQKAIDRSAVVDVRGDLIPTLIAFQDLHDPNSAQVVSTDAFAKTLGRGFSFRRATITMVRLGWWPFNELGLTGNSLGSDVSRRLPIIIDALERRRNNPILGYQGKPYSPHFRDFIRRSPWRDIIR